MVELNRQDLVERPENLVEAASEAAATANPGFNVGDIQKLIQGLPGKIKEIQKTFEILDQVTGGKLRKMLPQGFGNQGKEYLENPPNPAASMGGQFILMVQLLIAKYGDVSIKEVLDKATAEFGDTKLSDILKGKQK